MKTLLIIITLLFSVSLAGAELNQNVYKDNDLKPAPTMLLASAERGNKSTPGPAMAATVKKERFSGTVEIYITDWCGYCEKALKYMSSKGIPFVAYDIEKDSSADQRFKELGGRGVPLIIIGDNKMSGFSAERLEHYLNNSK